MRMRKKKHGKERLEACREYLYYHNGEPLDKPYEVFKNGTESTPVYLEIGAGKGGFAIGMTEANPKVCYFALERVSDCVVIAAESARAAMSENLKFVIDSADNLPLIFAPDTIDCIFLNFSDPWSKKGYAKRRLTHKRYLEIYLKLLKPGGTLRFKTDNLGLFNFTLEQLDEVGIKPHICTNDLHASEWNEGNVVTEYERAFSSQGIKINMLEFSRPGGLERDEGQNERN